MIKETARLSEPDLSAKTIHTVLQRILKEPAFRESFFSQPAKALLGYSLSDQEREALGNLAPGQVYAWVGYVAAAQLLPIRIGRRLVIAPDWLEVSLSPGEVLIRLDQQRTIVGIAPDGHPITWEGSLPDPGAPQAFGNGLHPTTWLCLEALETILELGTSILDLGTGSGILAIAAAKLKAGRVLALDTDAAAVEMARQHVRLNGVEKIVQVEQGSVESLRAPGGNRFGFPFRLIVANLTAACIRASLEAGLVAVLEPGGQLILSGFRASKHAEILEAVEAASLACEEQKQMEGWCALVLRRPSPSI